MGTENRQRLSRALAPRREGNTGKEIRARPERGLEDGAPTNFWGERKMRAPPFTTAVCPLGLVSYSAVVA